MRLEKFGDSYDIVKQSLLRWLSSLGPWAAHPMFTEAVQPIDAAAFSNFLGVRLLSTDVLYRESDRLAYFSSAVTCPEHVFLDPDTGLRVPAGSPADAHHFVNGGEALAVAQGHTNKLVLVFDQSLDRRYPSVPQIEAKLEWLAERGVAGLAYRSHACFVLASASHERLEQAYLTLLTESKLPSSRFVTSGKGVAKSL